MRRDRDDENVAQFRRQDRPPGSQRVGGGAGRCGGDQAVSDVRGQQVTVCAGGQPDRVEVLAAAHHGLVERVPVAQGCLGAG